MRVGRCTHHLESREAGTAHAHAQTLCMRDRRNAEATDRIAPRAKQQCRKTSHNRIEAAYPGLRGRNGAVRGWNHGSKHMKGRSRILRELLTRHANHAPSCIGVNTPNTHTIWMGNVTVQGRRPVAPLYKAQLNVVKQAANKARVGHATDATVDTRQRGWLGERRYRGIQRFLTAWRLQLMLVKPDLRQEPGKRAARRSV